MRETLLTVCNKVIELSYYLLFIIVPLILTPFNYELFEFNKMLTVYALTIIIVGISLSKMVLHKKINLKRTPLDIPLILFFISQIISTILSIDPHVSIFGYYSRFNGGLLSTISYILLYYAFVTNFPKEKIGRLLTVMLGTAALVAIYGILEHFGIDKSIWVQDVQNRVFSSLGQPNWLAAYVTVLLLITIGIIMSKVLPKTAVITSQTQNSKLKSQNQNLKPKNHWTLEHCVIGTLIILFYLTLLFTKSRSGFIGFWISLIIFGVIVFLHSITEKQAQKQSHIHAIAAICYQNTRLIGMIAGFLVFLTFIFGSPFNRLNRFTLPQLSHPSGDRTEIVTPTQNSGSSIIDIGITESGKIRDIVWRGAVDVVSHYPLFGSGVETFAFSYYKYRPAAHNLTSEWDFLYNKAHNEYLNYAATTGFVGLGTYLLFIAGFVGWNLQKLKTQISKIKTTTQMSKPENLRIPDLDLRFEILTLSLFSAWLSILITNFFGFSVVIIELLFFLIPAIAFTLAGVSKPFFSSPIADNHNQFVKNQPFNVPGKVTLPQYALLTIILLAIIFCLMNVVRLWIADFLFSQGYRLSHSQNYPEAYQYFHKAIGLNDSEPLYYDELTFPAAQLSLALSSEGKSTVAAELKSEAIATTDRAISISPNNVNFWKTRTRTFYALSQIDENYIQEAIRSLTRALELSPTDPKIPYNLALMDDQTGNTEASYQLLIKTTELKPDYRDAYFALAVFYRRDKKNKEASAALNFILTRINPNDTDAKKLLEELK